MVRMLAFSTLVRNLVRAIRICGFGSLDLTLAAAAVQEVEDIGRTKALNLDSDGVKAL